MSATHHDDLSIDGLGQSLFDPSLDQFSGWVFDDASSTASPGHDVLGESAGTLALTFAPFSSLDLGASFVAPHAHSDMFGGTADDAKGGGKPGGGGGGGGGGSGGLLTTYTSGNSAVDDANEFNIKIDFSGSWTVKEQAIVTWAADLLSTIITGDLTPDVVNGVAIDDVAITMTAGRIDGTGNPAFGNVLAQTSINYVRDAGWPDQFLPLTSSITLDSTDLSNSIKQGWDGTWDDIILHEMVHALGFSGVIFNLMGLVDSNANFNGAQAAAAYGGLPPLEDGGGSGTAGSHWDEATFAPHGVAMSNELMTGYVNYNEQTYLSDVTVQALADLGYHVQDPSAGAYLPIDSGLLLA